MLYFIYILSGIGAGIVTGIAGLSAAVVITPLLVGVCGWQSFDAVTVALTADIIASLLTAYTYYKNKNIDLKNGILVAITAFIGTIIGSYCGYLFSQSQPNGLGYISMVTTISLGIKFLVKPIEEGHDAEAGLEHISKKKIIQAMIFGCGIGWICGFTGSGGGILMLTVFTLLLGYNLKVAVGTSTMIMSLVALTGAVSHISMGAKVEIIPSLIVVIGCVIAAYVSAKFANKCEVKKLNKVVGICLSILGMITILLKVKSTLVVIICCVVSSFILIKLVKNDENKELNKPAQDL
jgi:uncharacterized membrane protein YfcA